MIRRNFFETSLASDLNNSSSSPFPTKELTTSSILTTNLITAKVTGNVSVHSTSSRESLYENTVDEIVFPQTSNLSSKCDAKILTTSSQPILSQFTMKGRLRNEIGPRTINLRECLVSITNMLIFLIISKTTLI